MFWILLAIGGLLLWGLRSHAVINTGLTEAGLKADFFVQLARTPTYWQELSTRVASTLPSEKYAWLGSTPMMREWIGGRQLHGIRGESYSVANKEYEAIIEVDRKELEDDQTGGIRMRAAEMAAFAATHKDYLLEQLLINGETTGFNSYDNVTFFNAAHESGKSGAQSNTLTYAATDGDNPTIAECRAALAQAMAKMVAYKDDLGVPMRIMPTPAGFVVICPPTQMFTWLEALALPLAPTVSNPLGPNILQNAARVFTFPGLTDASKWYLAKVDVPVRPFIFQDRMPIEFQALEGDEQRFKGRFLYGVRARYAITYGYWQYCVCTDFT